MKISVNDRLYDKALERIKQLKSKLNYIEGVIDDHDLDELHALSIIKKILKIEKYPISVNDIEKLY